MASPYVVGSTLILQRHGIAEEFQARILEVYEPFTLSCVVKVEFQEGSIEPSEAILKLYDRRFAIQLRKDQGVEPWTEEYEAAYVDFVRSGGAMEFRRKLRAEEDVGDSGTWSSAENEAFLQDYCVDTFEDEADVYDVLRDYQGAEIPVLLGSVQLKGSPSSSEDIAHEHGDLLNINGLLLEYIPGITFAEINEENLPRTSWQDVVDQAIRITHIFSDSNILNEDVRPANIIATPDSTKECGHRAVMIDFGLCRFREEGEPESDWGRAKHTQDEEGAVGMVMATRLRSYGFELEFKPSRRYMQYAEPEFRSLYT
jgi:hypothetical protein